MGGLDTKRPTSPERDPRYGLREDPQDRPWYFDTLDILALGRIRAWSWLRLEDSAQVIGPAK